MKFTGLLKFWPPTPPRPEPHGVGWVKIKFYWFSGQFMTFPGLLIFWPPKIPTGGGGIFFYRFSRQFMKFTGLFKFWPPTPPPQGGEVYFFRQEPSPDLQGFMQVGKYDSIAHRCGAWRFWHVGASTRYCLGRNVRHCGKVSKCEFSSFWAIHLYHGGWV